MQSTAPTRLPEYPTESRCRVCSAPDRDVSNGAVVRNLVDELLMLPKSCSAVARMIEPLMESWPEDTRISKDSVSRHAKRHLNWEQTAVRQIAERRASEAGKVHDVAGRMLTA